MKRDNEIKESQIKKDLMSLNIIPQDKLLIWLLFKDFKQGTELTYRLSFMEKVGENIFHTKNRLERFFLKYDFKYKKYFLPFLNGMASYAISYKQDVVEELVKINTSSINPDNDTKNCLRLGTIFGYPKEAVKNYAILLNKKVSGHYYEDIWKKLKAKNYYWEPYVMYLPRINHIKEDSLIAKQWADLTKKEFHKLDREITKFEKENKFESGENDIVIYKTRK